MPQTIRAAIVHKIDKEPGAAAILVLAEAVLDPQGEALHSLLSQVGQVYRGRANKQYGQFDSTGAFPGIRAALQELCTDEQADFLRLSQTMMAVLKGQADQQNFATGGHVLLVDWLEDGRRWFVVAVLNSVEGAAIDAQLRIVAAPHLDLNGLRFAGRVDVSRWLNQEGGRYISFLRGRTAEVSRYFQHFLGCVSVAQDLQDTRALVLEVKRFARDRGWSGEEQQELLNRVHAVCLETAERSEAVSLEALCNEVLPQEPEALREALARAEPPIADGFMIERAGLRGLRRLVARGPGWRLDCDRDQLSARTIRLDRARGLLLITLPPAAIEDLSDEFPQADADQS